MASRFYGNIVRGIIGALLWVPAFSARAVDGTIPNLTYTQAELFKQISPKLSSLHLNQPTVYNGYLILAGNGVHEIWDIANPYAPVKRKTITSPFAAGEAESHQVTYSRTTNGTCYMATISGKGLDIWNVTVTTNPVLVTAMQLPNINYGDVAGAIWGMAWQGKYIYAGATVHGLYVIDVSDITQPVHIKTLSQSGLGGVSAGPLFALGNLLVVTTPKDTAGIATVDISNPTDPKLLDSVTGGAHSYIGGFYGGNAFLITPLRTYDVTTDPGNIQLLAQSTVPASEYVSFADNFLFLGGLRGGTEGVYKYSITNPASPTLIGRFVGRNSAWDDQFSCPIGNLIAVADDQLVNNQFVGGLLAVHDVNPDTKPPTVMKVFPADSANQQPLLTRIAVSLSEWPEFATVNSSTFIVRPVGGQPVPGSWSCTYTLLNFTPTEPLLPNTTYEIVLPSGGIRDLVGNAIATQFVSMFQTASGVVGFPGDLLVAPVPPTPLGTSTTFSLAFSAAPGMAFSWDFGDGVTNNGATVQHTYAAPGRYAVTLRGTQSNALYEAEHATLSGGVLVQTEHSGYTGTGYADFPGTTGANVYIRWNVNLLASNTVNLSFRFANGGDADRPLHMIINGGAVSNVSFPVTAEWYNYGTVTRTNISLLAGTNTIMLRATAGSVGANIDSMTVIFPNAGSATRSFSHIVHRPLSSPKPAHSQPLALDVNQARLWVVNPDNDTVSSINTETLTKLGEFPVGDQPESVALAPDGSVWVANHGSATISVLNSNGNTIATVPLPRASLPYGIVFAPNGSNAYVALQALGRVVKIHTATRAITASLDLPLDTNGIRPQIRSVAISGDGASLYVSRFISPDHRGEIFEVNPNTMTLVRTIGLANDPGPDTPAGSRGIPNYLTAMAINPDGTRLWIPSKKDNIERGVLRDGNNLTHDMTVRAISSSILLSSGTELPGERIDFDNRDRAHGICFSTLGDIAFVTMPGNNHVQAINTYTGQEMTQMQTEKTPTGVLYDAARNRLYVLNFLSRNLSVFNVENLINAIDNVTPQIGSPIPLIAVEALAANVLKGKELFYDAGSTRLNQEGYMSCASCHLDGSQDGRIWDFTGSGEGLRNTIDLRGRAGMAHGRLHWSANFDEVQDFEGQIRSLGEGIGLMSNSNFYQGTRAHPLGLMKQGLSPDLDALAEYVVSLNRVPDSPHRNPDGTLTASAIAGREVFNQMSCFACHGGTHFTDSGIGGFHNIGTIKPSSGNRLGAELAGIDTPTLRGVWATAPYLHDGSAPTLRDVFTSANPTSVHGVVTGLSTTEISQLIAYLNQIDQDEPDADPATHADLPLFANFISNYDLPPGMDNPMDDPDEDGIPNVMEYAEGGSNPAVPNGTSSIRTMAEVAPGSESGLKTFHFSYLRRAGGYWQNGKYRVGDLIYLPEASYDLSAWNLPLVLIDNPSGLPAHPAGYEWVTYLMVQPPEADEIGFGRVNAIFQP